jgi:hypothetical protein
VTELVAEPMPVREQDVMALPVVVLHTPFATLKNFNDEISSPSSIC